MKQWCIADHEGNVKIRFATKKDLARYVMLADILPWDDATEDEYAANHDRQGTCRPDQDKIEVFIKDVTQEGDDEV